MGSRVRNSVYSNTRTAISTPEQNTPFLPCELDSKSPAAMAGDDEGREDDDYMGDLSLFLPSESQELSSSSKKVSGAKSKAYQAPKEKNAKTLSWQERRRMDRERKQQEEDQRTLAGTEAAIPPSNVGFKMLRMMGYSPGSALGKDGTGRAEPVGLEIRRSRAGIGKESPAVERARKEREMGERKRWREEDMMEEFGSRQKTQWRSRRVAWDYQKAETALAQLDNREVLEPDKEADGEEEKPEEEEKEITEEDLQGLLMKLRDEHQYCLYCGCQYESAESLETNCPGLNEEDH